MSPSPLEGRTICGELPGTCQHFACGYQLATDVAAYELGVARSAIWAALQMSDRPAQAAGILRSALPDGYWPVAA